MPRKKSIRRSARDFGAQVAQIAAFLRSSTRFLSDDQVSWIHEYAILRLYREFERLVLECLVGAINNDTQTIATRTGIQFPKHLTQEVCEYLVVGDGYLAMHGRDGLIATIKRFVPNSHYLPTTMKKHRYKQSLDELLALRNFAAHSSSLSKRRAKEVLGVQRIGSAGACLKAHLRMDSILRTMLLLAHDIADQAPY